MRDWVIAFLGNPGDRYAATRHNLGWWVADGIAAKAKAKFRPGLGDYLLAECRVAGRKAHLLKPTTYMNGSGLALDQYARWAGLVPGELIAVADDIALPLGEVRIRARGSSGGHNGLASIIEHLGSDEFTRVRCGVGPVPPGVDAAEFVLDDFTQDELLPARQMADRAMLAVEMILARGVSAAANTYNRKPPATEAESPSPPDAQ
ncbi:MAG: aminoacyl-tRNA hydrolase [Candidatus Zixiibacteriota bacterium]